MGVQAELVLLLMFASTVKSQGVYFWRNNVTLTCPGNGDWHDTEKKIGEGKTYETKYEKPLAYHCQYTEEDDDKGPKKYFFYVRGKTCQNCFELDAAYFGIALVVDLIGTAGLMMIIFKCAKKGSSDGPAQSPRPPVPTGSRPPDVPNRDYEQLNPRTRAAETYSTVVNRMG